MNKEVSSSHKPPLSIKHSSFHWQIETEILIDAPTEKVWSVLMDTPALKTWSTSFRGFGIGDLSQGGQVDVYFLMLNKEKIIHHTLTEYEEGQRFAWSDPIIPGLRDNHQYILEAVSDNQTRFIQNDELKGWAAFFMGRFVMKQLLKMYPDFNQKLKQAAESL